MEANSCSWFPMEASLLLCLPEQGGPLAPRLSAFAPSRGTTAQTKATTPRAHLGAGFAFITHHVVFFRLQVCVLPNSSQSGICLIPLSSHTHQFLAHFRPFVNPYPNLRGQPLAQSGSRTRCTIQWYSPLEGAGGYASVGAPRRVAVPRSQMRGRA